ncbi:MAG: hypothetical protein AMXMBFR4_17450 [Candidatus Hydrogenedentota bacterium]
MQTKLRFESTGYSNVDFEWGEAQLQRQGRSQAQLGNERNDAQLGNERNEGNEAQLGNEGNEGNAPVAFDPVSCDTSMTKSGARLRETPD